MPAANAIDILGGANTASAAQSKAKLEDELNKFLNLLVTQLKNQDPLEPMDATEFTNQLVQFASVEQQIYQNANLEKLLESAHISQVSNLANYLGTNIEAQTDSLNLANSTARLTYTLVDDAKTSKIVITDDSGKAVYTGVAEKAAGRHEFVWDGLDDNGIQLPDGTYNFTINAFDADDEPLQYARSVFGIVTAAGSDEGAVRLYMGDVTVGLEDVVAVSKAPVPAADPVP